MIENRSAMQPLALQSFRLVAGAPVHYSVDVEGTVTMELLALNGAKIGTIMNEQVSAGNNSFRWNGKTIEGKSVGSVFAVLRLSSPQGTVTRMVSTGR